MSRWGKKYPNKWINQWTVIFILCTIGVVVDKLLFTKGIDTYFVGLLIGSISMMVPDLFDLL